LFEAARANHESRNFDANNVLWTNVGSVKSFFASTSRFTSKSGLPCSLTAAAYGGENVVFASDAEGPTIVVWLVLLVMALMVVAFVSRLVEEYRLADRFSNVQKERLYHAKQHAPS
jgi:hypothetical protein